VKWFIYVIKIYMHNLILWWRNHLIAIPHLLIIYASNHFIHATAFQISMSSFIYHILLSLADLSLIYSCRLHSQSICHATRSINLHTGCIPCDWSIFIPAAYPTIDQSSYRLHTPRPGNLPIHYSIDPPTYQPRAPKWRNLSTSYTIDQSAYQLHAPQWRNLRTYWPLNWPTYISAARSAMEESAYQLHN